MNELLRILEETRAKIAQYQGKELNEENTKKKLIEPVLCALGWDVSKDEVSLE